MADSTVTPIDNPSQGLIASEPTPTVQYDYSKTTLRYAEIYTMTFADGSIGYFTSHDKDLVYSGNTYQAIPIRRGAVNYHADLQVDKVSVEMGLVGLTIGTASLTIPQVIRRDFFREAHVQIWAVDWGSLSATHVVIFDGYVTGPISFNQGILAIEVGSLLDKLQDKFPKVVYTESCNHALYSTWCGVQSTAYQETSTAADGSNTTRIYSAIFNSSAHSTAGTTGYWAPGKITFTSGDNNGVSRSIFDHGDGWIDVLIPLPESVSTTDQFTALPGCDKTGQTCDEKFNNYANFLGFETIPKPDVLIYSE